MTRIGRAHWRATANLDTDLETQAQALALAIVDTLPEPFLVLDDSLQLLAGSRCFYEI